MKRIICSSLFLLLMINGTLTAQVKSDSVYKSLKGFSITVLANKLVHTEYADKRVSERVNSELNGITKLRFISDSLAQVQSKSGSKGDIQVKNIVSVTFRRDDGSHAGLGAIVGVLGGALVGGVIGAASEDESSFFRGLPTVVGITSGVIIGGLTGLLIGSNISAESDEVFDLSQSAKKKAELERLLIRNRGR